MKTERFTVDVKEVWCHTIEIEVPAGSSREDILAAAQRRLSDGEEGTTEYDSTLPPATWNVRDNQGKYF